MSRPSILFLSRWFPYPPDNGARMRVYNVLRELSIDFDLHLISYWENQPPSSEELDSMADLCQEIDLIPYPGGPISFTRSVRGWVSPRPRSILEKDSQALRMAVQKALASRRFDVVMASQIDMALYASEVTGPARILEELEVAAVTHRNANAGWLRNSLQRLTILKLRAYLGEILPRFAVVTTVSEQEKAGILHLTPNYERVCVIPNGIDLARYQGRFAEPEAGVLVYPGALTFSANLDAVRFFAGQILPRLRELHPGVRLLVTGPTKGVDLTGIADAPGIVMTGYVPDIRPIIAGAWACVAPIRQGGGTRIKILEALALGTPVVATPKGAEGLGLLDGQEFLLAGSPERFVEETARLLSSAELRTRLSQQGKAVVQNRFSWSPIGAQLRQMVHEAIASTTLPY